MLAVDSTIFIQIANFLLLLLCLNIFLYKPIRRILIQRNQEINSLQEMIETCRNQVEQSSKGIEENKVQAQKEGYTVRENLKGRGQEEERMILQEANTLVENKIGKARSEMEAELVNVRKSLEVQLDAFSKELAEKILGRRV